jgi:hypothetical protein
VEYDIAQGKTRKLLVEQVNKAIQDGWKPIGGVMYDFEDTLSSTSSSERSMGPNKYSSSTRSISHSSESHTTVRNAIYFQAMIKE